MDRMKYFPDFETAIHETLSRSVAELWVCRVICDSDLGATRRWKITRSV